jgi:hypothetical protein
MNLRRMFKMLRTKNGLVESLKLSARLLKSSEFQNLQQKISEMELSELPDGQEYGIKWVGVGRYLLFKCQVDFDGEVFVYTNQKDIAEIDAN